MRFRKVVWVQHASTAIFWRVKCVDFMQTGSILFQISDIVVHKSGQKYQEVFEYYLFLVVQHILWSKLE